MSWIWKDIYSCALLILSPVLQNKFNYGTIKINCNSPDLAFEFDGSYFYFGGWNLEESEIPDIVDDLVSVDPWRVSGD